MNGISGNVKADKKTRLLYRTLLIAAVITAVLICTACASDHFEAKDLVLRELDNGCVTYSFVGWRNTPEYQACAEWTDYLIKYEETLGSYLFLKYDESTPVEYLRVGAFNEELIDAVDGILAKYDLALHPAATIKLPAAGSSIDVGILPGDAKLLGGYAYKDGTMLLEVSKILSDGEEAEFQLFSTVKGTFTAFAGIMESNSESWRYTAADGTEVTLLQTGNESVIVADLDHVFVTAQTVFRNVSDRAALEEIADSICWKELNAAGEH